jgi:hypothetical protein
MTVAPYCYRKKADGEGQGYPCARPATCRIARKCTWGRNSGELRTDTPQVQVTDRMTSGSGLIQHIQDAETQAMRDGFIVTARALNQAKNAAGWEMAGNIAQADLARVGKRSGED